MRMVKIDGVLCVFAHPDDEQFGTAGALLACIEHGLPVHLVCATRGDRGEISDPSLATPETLGQVREGELRTASALLGIEPPVILGFGDGTLSEVDAAALRDAVVAEIRRVQPAIVLTFDANGGYGHPDHIAMHRATLAAFPLAGDAGYRPELGAAHSPRKLYVTAYPKSSLEVMNEGLRTLGLPPIDFGDVQTIDADELGTADERITTVVSVERLYERRMASLFAHRTQYGPESIFARFPDDLNRRLAAFDYFIRLIPAPPQGAWLPDEANLWDGLAAGGQAESGQAG
jgi:LmbE family N-acetylglucosaminyl deacetylase